MVFRHSRHRFSFQTLLWATGLAACCGGSAMAASAMQAPLTSSMESGQETLITAAIMTSDQDTHVVTAEGRVEIARGNYILHADKVTYNQKTGVMHAEGHVAMLMPSGEVEFSDSQDVTGDMKQAFIKNIGILFPDNSRLAAKTAQRYEGKYLVADQGVYTSCNVCKADPDHPPLWQVRGDQIVHDNVEHNVYFHNATIDLAGVPVFYTPYFSAPDPTVDRRQGFLSPQPGYTTNLGGVVRTPYYFDIAPDMDATFIPIFSQKDTLQLGGEVRKRFDSGNMQFDGSFTHANLISDTGVNEGTQWRGHLFGTTLFNLDNVWRAGSDIALASDKSYLQRYNYSGATELTNRFYAEGFKGRDYAAVNSYYFEDLRPGTQVVQPLILPQANFSAMGEPGRTWGGRWAVNGNMLATSRDNSNQSLSQQGPDTRRLYFDTGWQRQFVSNTGLLTTLSGMARVDGESADNVINPNGSGQNFDNVLTAHQFEQANVTTRYPVARQGDGYQQLLEPIAALTAAPVVHHDVHQPIEDSADVQFDETNLFAANRFTGYDLVEGGSRATYGLRHEITGSHDEKVDMFGGQSYNFSQHNFFPQASGLHTHMSDYVGRTEFVPTNWLSFNYGVRIDSKSLSTQRQDASLSVGQDIFRPYVHYISGDIVDTTGLTSNNEEAIAGFDSAFQKYWHFHAEHTQAFSPQPGARTSSAVLSYADECYIFAVSLNRNDLIRADVSSGTSIMFHMFLKNVGGIHSDSYAPTHDAFPARFRDAE